MQEETRLCRMGDILGRACWNSTSNATLIGTMICSLIARRISAKSVSSSKDSSMGTTSFSFCVRTWSRTRSSASSRRIWLRKINISGYIGFDAYRGTQLAGHISAIGGKDFNFASDGTIGEVLSKWLFESSIGGCMVRPKTLKLIKE